MPAVTIDGLNIFYHHHQPASGAAGQRVMYIHGTGCNGAVFARHLESVAVRHEVVAIDLPGHGKSAGTGFCGMADYAHVVAALINRLGWTSCVVAGHSMGGGVALSVGLYFSPLVHALMLIDTGARLRVNPKLIAIARAIAEGRYQARDDSRMGFADSTPQSVVDAMNAATAGCDPWVNYKDWIADDSFDVMSRVAGIDMPTLAICGERDPLTPLKYHEYLRDHMPNCQLEVVANAGHWPFAENPNVFDEKVLRFLASL